MSDERFNAIERRVTALETRDAVDEVHHKNITGRLDSIEDTLKWLVRLIIGGIGAGLIAYMLQGGLAV